MLALRHATPYTWHTAEHTSRISEASFDNDVLVSHGLMGRIKDLRKQIYLMSDQLGKKDDQLTQLNEITQKQTTHSEPYSGK